MAAVSDHEGLEGPADISVIRETGLDMTEGRRSGEDRRVRLRLSPRKRTPQELTMLWIKSLSWRAISTGILVVIGKAVTEEWTTGGLIAVIHTVITIGLYVPHDLVWERWEIRNKQRGAQRERWLAGDANGAPDPAYCEVCGMSTGTVLT